jgi:hypothetical protein
MREHEVQKKGRRKEEGRQEGRNVAKIEAKWAGGGERGDQRRGEEREVGKEGEGRGGKKEVERGKVERKEGRREEGDRGKNRGWDKLVCLFLHHPPPSHTSLFSYEPANRPSSYLTPSLHFKC